MRTTNKFNSRSDIKFMQKNGQTKIGEGSFGNVRLISHIQNSTKLFALKTMEVIDDLEEKYIKQEIDLHISLNHKNIIKLVDYFFEDKIAYIILEYAAKGDLFHYLHRTSNIPQEQLEKIFINMDSNVLIRFKAKAKRINEEQKKAKEG